MSNPFTALVELVERRRITFFATLGAGLAITTAGLVAVPRAYDATSHVLIARGSDAAFTPEQLPAIATSAAVIALAGADVRPGEQIAANLPAGSNILNVTVRDTSDQRAVRAANAIADALRRDANDVATERADLRVSDVDRDIAAAERRLRAATGAVVRAVATGAPAPATLAQLRAQRDLAEDAYYALSAQRTTIEGNRAEALDSLVVVDRAVHADVSVFGLGRMQLTLLLGTLVLIAAIGAACIAESLDPRLRRKEQIERLYGKPVLTVFHEDDP
jgi:uncharacterized protein involved in exopolysaccharide biosynthesis